MNPRVQRIVLIAVLLLLLVFFALWWDKSHKRPVPPPGPAPVPVSTGSVAAPAVTKPAVPPAPVATKPVIPKAVVPPVSIPPAPKPTPAPTPTPPAPVSTPAIPTPPKISLHPELIPKNIEIVRCYYGREIVGPDTIVGFDINGSGFTNEFQNMIRVETGGLDIQVQNLRLVTANQIHGELVVGSAQTTDFIYPRVLIKGLPVFRAPDPFAVVRPGEVLTIIFISLAEDGRSGRFRVITNLNENMSKQFKLIPTNPGLEISPLEFHLPFAVEGVMQIGMGVAQGEYGMKAMIGQREVWKREGMIRIVRPNVGLTGFVQGVSSVDRFHRPGDTAHFYLHGSGLTPAYVSALQAKVNEMDMGPGAFEFVSAAQMRFTFQIPKNASLRPYGITILDAKNNELFKKDDVFVLVPNNWIGGVQIAPPIKPGQQGLLRVLGRDMSPDFVNTLQLSVDEPGIQLKNIRSMDPSTVGVDITISSAVAPGDYWIHLTYQGKPIQPPYGSIIKVEHP